MSDQKDLCSKANTAKHPIRVACVGDSITYGSGIADRDHDGYPAQLGRKLGEGWEVRNFGVGGTTALRRGDFPYSREAAYAEALAWQPQVVVIALGTNDTKPQNWCYAESFARDLESLADAFLEVDPTAEVYLCLPVPAFPGEWGIRDDVVREKVVPQIRELAARRCLPTIDLYSALSSHPELFPDTVHPSAEGAGWIASEVHLALTCEG